MSERGRRLELCKEWGEWHDGSSFNSWLMDKVIALEEKLSKQRTDVTNDACGDALQKLWDEILVARRPLYGDWEYPAQAYRHIKAEFDQVKDALAGVLKLIDDGVLVRDILHDHRADWAIRQLPMIEALKKAQEALGERMLRDA